MINIDLTPLHHLPSSAAGYITEKGWTQGVEQDDTGSVCLTGALRYCSPVPWDKAVKLAEEIINANEEIRQNQARIQA